MKIIDKKVQFNIGLLTKVSYCLISTAGVLWYLNIPNNFAAAFVIFVLFLFLYEKFVAKYKYYSLGYSILLSAILVIGGQLDSLSVINWDLGTFLKIIMLAVSLYLPVYKVMGYLDETLLKRGRELSKKDKILIYLVVVISNLLIFTALFPGIYGWDSAMQSYRAMNGGMTSHWSVPLGYLFSFMLNIGKNLFGDYGYGMAIAMFLQLLFVSFVYAKVVFFVNKRYKNNCGTVLTICYFIFVLLFGAMSVYSTQDTIFGAIFALIFIELYEISQDENYWESKRRILKYILLGVLLCLCRNNGVYILILVAVVAFFILKGKRNVLYMLVPVMFSFIYSGLVLNMAGIPNNTSINEMMSIPSQQMARVYIFNNQSLSDEDREKIEYYYDDMDRFLEYETFMAKADKTKGALDSNKVKGSVVDYISLWVKLGIKSPRNYVEAFLLNSLGTWYPGKMYNDSRARIGYIEYEMNTLWDEYNGEYANMKIERNSKLGLYEKFLAFILYENGWQKIPLLSMLYSIGSYFVLTVFSIIIIFYRKNYKLLIPMALVAGLYITVLMGPVAIFRYCYPVLIVSPIIVLGLFRERGGAER